MVVPDFDNKTVRIIVADDSLKYATELPILEEADSTYWGRTASQIDEPVDIQYNTEQGLVALIYGENEIEMTPISSLEQGMSSDRNDYVYYFSVEFEK